MYKIEKNIPINPINPERDFPLKDMEIGDSFLIPKSEINEIKIRAHVRVAADRLRIKQKSEFGIAIRKQPNGDLRVFRIK